MATDVGTLEFDDAEVTALRAYLLKGGFLWVDDFWGIAGLGAVDGADAAGCCPATPSSTCRPTTRSAT